MVFGLGCFDCWFGASGCGFLVVLGSVCFCGLLLYLCFLLGRSTSCYFWCFGCFRLFRFAFVWCFSDLRLLDVSASYCVVLVVVCCVWFGCFGFVGCFVCCLFCWLWVRFTWCFCTVCDFVIWCDLGFESLCL